MRQFRSVFSVFVLFLLCLSIAKADNWLEKPVATHGEGCLYKTDGLSVVVLKGNWYEMGVQYGTLLKDEMQSLRDIQSQVVTALNVDAERLEKMYGMAEKQLRCYPNRFREIQRGMMDGSGFSLRDLAILEHYIAIQCIADRDLFCSALTVWGDYTKDGELIMGRNLDFPKSYLLGCPFFCLAVFIPNDGSIPTATLGYAGSIGTTSMFNAAGLVAEYNIAANVEEPVELDRINPAILMVNNGFECSSMEQLDVALQTNRFLFALLCTVADAKESRTYEMGTVHFFRRNPDKPGVNTVTNWAIAPEWEKITAPPGPLQKLDPRQDNLRAQAEKMKGKFDRDEMKKVLDVKILDGGTVCPPELMFPGLDVMIVTVYQFVYKPKTFQLSLRQPYSENKDWIDIDLGKLLENDETKALR